MERRRRAKPHVWTHVVLAAHAVAAPAARHARLDGNSVPGDEVGDALAASVGFLHVSVSQNVVFARARFDSQRLRVQRTRFSHIVPADVIH